MIYMERAHTGKEELDNNIEGGYQVGRTIMVTGTTGSGKTIVMNTEADERMGGGVSYSTYTIIRTSIKEDPVMFEITSMFLKKEKV